MSLTSAMFTGVGGLFAYGQAMNVIGDNIANVNTVGFKSSRPVFSDVLATSIAGSSSQIGHGSSLSSVALSFQQGSTETTGNSTDLAIQGSGFFIVGDPNARYYSRAGQFILDENGRLVNGNSDIVQGYDLDTAGNTTGALTNVDLAGVQSVPNASTLFRLGANLDAAASAGTTFQTAINLFNSLGEITVLNVTFTKSATALNWDYAMSAAVAGAASGSLTVTGGTGSLVFNSAGTLTSPTTEPTLTISGFTTSGAADIALTWDLLDTGGSLRGDMSSYAASSVTNSITQDGFSTGTLKGISVDSDGLIAGLFSNGQTQQLMQLGLADFLSPWGLTRVGNSLYAESADSGQPIVGLANSGGFGSIIGNSLELSNVDIAAEFVNLIQTQRAYQANSRIITTVDEMLAETVNIKR